MTRSDRLALALLPLHPDRRRSLVESSGSASRALAAVRAGRVDGIDASLVQDPDAGLAALAKAGARPVMLGDDDYPAWLASIGDPPDVLFVIGDLPPQPGVAVVGTRRCTAYGRSIAAGYGRAIAAAGWPLISGLARGIDGVAHRATVEVGGVGVAVLGSGIDVVYPREHETLLRALIDGGGAVVSEYAPGAEPLGWRFPPRNRIIAGLSAAVVVVESAVTGGALVTAARAAEQGRVLFATPGDVGRAASVGCNLLIRDGAVPVFDPDDLIEALSLVLGPPDHPASRAEAEPSPEDVPVTGLTIDQFGEATGLQGADLLALIGRLEVEGKVRREGDRIVPRGM